MQIMFKKLKHHFLLFHGDEDDFVRYRDNGKIVYNNAPQPKDLILVQKANHTNVPYILGTEQYLQIISDWIDFSLNNNMNNKK